MSDAILLTGKRGEGKTLISMNLIKRYLSANRTIATNININVEKLVAPWNKTTLTRLPDLLTYQSLQDLTPANLTYDESKNGLLVLDEASIFLNAHDWRNDETKKIRAWVAQSRKDGWDLLFLAQNEKQLDSQIRNSIFELHGIARNMKKVGVPVLSFLARYFFGITIRLPAFHVFTLKYGFGANSAVAETDIIGGSNLYDAYDTKQKINLEAADPSSTQLFGSAPCTMLSAWHLKGRYLGNFKMYGKIAALMLVFGLLIGGFSGYLFAPEPEKEIPQKPIIPLMPVAITEALEPVQDTTLFITGKFKLDGRDMIIMSDGRHVPVNDFKADVNGTSYKVGQFWYKY